MKRESPNWPLILTLYSIAAVVLFIVRDDVGTGNVPHLKVVGWIALTFAVYWSIRGAFACVGKPSDSASDAPSTSQLADVAVVVDDPSEDVSAPHTLPCVAGVLPR